MSTFHSIGQIAIFFISVARVSLRFELESEEMVFVLILALQNMTIAI